MKKTDGLRKLWYSLSSNQRFFIRRLYYLPIDFFDKITGKSHKFVAPRGLIYTGTPASAKKFIAHGKQQLELLKKYISINPDDHILDVGSGIGRTAIALTEYLSKNAKYEGFDAVQKGIDWCNSKITKDFPNFNFTYTPISNDLYNDSGLKASEFIFPYKDYSFDKVFLFSVFTHMQIDEIQNYLEEIKRVLKPGGLCLTTLFSYNSDNESYISSREEFNFPINGDGFKLMNEKVKSSNIAISENKLNEMISKAGFSKQNFVDGFWKDAVFDGTKEEYQDILVLRKE